MWQWKHKDACLRELLEGIGPAGRPSLDGLPGDDGEPGRPPGGDLLAVYMPRRVAQPRICPLPPPSVGPLPSQALRLLHPDGGGGRGIDGGGLDLGEGGLGLAVGGDGARGPLFLPPEGGGGGGGGGVFAEGAAHCSSAHRRPGSERDRSSGEAVQIGNPRFRVRSPLLLDPLSLSLSNFF